MRKGSQASISSGRGFLFPGGRHFRILQMYTVPPLQFHGLDNLGQQLPGRPDKRSSLGIFICTGRFSHKNKGCVRISFTENDVFSSLMKGTAGTVTQIAPDIIQ